MALVNVDEDPRRLHRTMIFSFLILKFYVHGILPIRISVYFFFFVPGACRGQKVHQIPYDGCELPYGCWDSNPGLLEEQSVILIIGLSLQALFP